MFEIKDKVTGDILKEHKEYININKDVIEGFDYDKHDIFIIVIKSKPSYDSNKETLQEIKEYTEDIHEEYPKVKICNKGYTIIELPTSTVIDKLNASLGTHLDIHYPLWERIKHSGEGNYIVEAQITRDLTQEQADRRAYIDSIYQWTVRCRKERDTKEIEFLTNDIFPSFTWEDRPN